MWEAEGVSAKQVGFQKRKELRLEHQKPDSQSWGRNPEESERSLAGEETHMEASPHCSLAVAQLEGLLGRQRAYCKGRAWYALTPCPQDSACPPMPAFKSPMFSGGGEMPTSHRLGGWKQARSAAGPVLVWPRSGVKDPCTNTFICNTHTQTCQTLKTRQRPPDKRGLEDGAQEGSLVPTRRRPRDRDLDSPWFCRHPLDNFG